MPPSLAEIVEKWFCPACRVFEGRTHIWKDPCRNDECARRWHADTESGSKYCSRECGIQVAKRRLEASNEKRKKAWRDSIIEREAKEREVVFRERVAGLVGVPPSEWAEEAEPKDVWISPLDEDDLARLREIRHEKSLARNEMKAWLSRKVCLRRRRIQSHMLT